MSTFNLKKRLVHFMLDALLVVYFLGCSYIFEISIIENDPFSPTFVLKKPSSIEPFRRGVPLDAFWVYEKESERKIWYISLPLGSSKRIYRLNYAEVPEGFEEVIAAESLSPDVVYGVLGSGAGCAGSAEFEIIKKDDTYEIVAKNE